MKDTYHTTKVVQAIVPAVKTAAADGTAVYLHGFDSALIVINTGAIAGAGDFSVKMQESYDGASVWSDVDPDDLLGSIPATLEASSAYQVGYIGKRPFIRANVTTAGGTSIALGAVAVLSNPAIAPT